MKKLKLETIDYIINNVNGFTLDEWLRLMKVKYGNSYERLFLENDIHPDLKEHTISVWNSLKEMKVKDAFKEVNIEKRRVYFNCIGPEKLFKNNKSVELLDTQVLNKIYSNGKNKISYKDEYKLYKIKGEDLGLYKGVDVYYVTCTCPSTGRLFYIFVRPPYWFNTNSNNYKNETYDAIDAICSTFSIRSDQDIIEKIYRQGDILLIKKSIGVNKYHYYGNRSLTREEYLNKLTYET
jgi:hypothetical protein